MARTTPATGRVVSIGNGLFARVKSGRSLIEQYRDWLCTEEGRRYRAAKKKAQEARQETADAAR